jgi:hypothetical protein
VSSVWRKRPWRSCADLRQAPGDPGSQAPHRHIVVDALFPELPPFVPAHADQEGDKIGIKLRRHASANNLGGGMKLLAKLI